MKSIISTMSKKAFNEMLKKSMLRIAEEAHDDFKDKAIYLGLYSSFAFKILSYAFHEENVEEYLHCPKYLYSGIENHSIYFTKSLEATTIRLCADNEIYIRLSHLKSDGFLAVNKNAFYLSSELETRYFIANYIKSFYTYKFIKDSVSCKHPASTFLYEFKMSKGWANPKENDFIMFTFEDGAPLWCSTIKKLYDFIMNIGVFALSKDEMNDELAGEPLDPIVAEVKNTYKEEFERRCTELSDMSMSIRSKKFKAARAELSNFLDKIHEVLSDHDMMFVLGTY